MSEQLAIPHIDLVAQVEAIVSQRLSNQQAGHGMDHVRRVLKTSRLIQSEVGGNRLVIDLAALLHDIGDAKFHQGIERGGEYSKEILEQLNAPPSVVEQVVSIVEKIPFRKGISASELCLEGKIVQDADRLEALGAIGIVRTIEYGALLGQAFYLKDADKLNIKTSVGHFHDKLFKLRNLLNTDTARRMALKRESFMRDFLKQYLEECGED